MTKLIFGCGYLGSRVAQRWTAAGERVVAVTRSSQRAAQLATSLIEPLVADVTRSDTLRALPAVDTVFFAVGFDRASGLTQDEVYVGGLRNVLAALPGGLQRFIYVSTTGVYGPQDADWVDEETPPAPVAPGGKAHLAAEAALASSRFARSAIVLRMAGLYGPGRVPRCTEIAAGEPIAAPREGWLNLIHVDDAAGVVVAAESAARPPRVYNVSDGHPATRQAYLEEMARLLAAPPPTFVDSPPAPSQRPPSEQRGAASKRISNRRMLAELSVRLAYQDYRAGLKATLT